MAVRRRIAKAIEAPLKRVGVQTPILKEIPLRAEIISQMDLELPRILGRIPVIVRGKAYGEVAGRWYRVLFPRPIRDPSVVPVGEARKGAIPDIKAPTISVPKVTVAIPKVLIKVAEAKVPKIAEIKVPAIDLPRIPTAIGEFQCGWAISGLCDSLNTAMGIIENGLVRINELRDKLATTLEQVRSSMENMDAKVDDLRTKVNDAIELLRVDVQTKVNTGLSTFRTNVQSPVNKALGSLGTNVSDAVSNGLTKVIPALYDAWGIPRIMALTPLHVRNVTTTGFEFQSYGKTTCYYIAVGERF